MRQYRDILASAEALQRAGALTPEVFVGLLAESRKTVSVRAHPTSLEALSVFDPAPPRLSVQHARPPRALRRVIVAP